MRRVRNTLFAGVTLMLPLVARAATLNPIADAFVTTGPSGNLVNSNYGKAGALELSASGSAKGTFQSVMKFDSSSVRTSLDSQYGAGLWTIQSITLQLTATSGGNPIFNTSTVGQFNVSLMQNNSWSEGTGTPGGPTADGITYTSLQNSFINNATDQDLGTFSFAGGTSGANSYSLTLSSGLISDLMSGTDFSLRLSAADSGVSYTFNSEDNGVAGNHPLLTVNAVPEPGSLALCGLGFALLAGCRWRMRATNS